MREFPIELGHIERPCGGEQLMCTHHTNKQRKQNIYFGEGAAEIG